MDKHSVTRVFQRDESMSRFVWITFILFGILMIQNTLMHAQISPGDLAKAHEELEGIRNCTQCHTIGKKIANDKCLACHDHIKIRIQENRGYHASQKVKTKDCASCHSDHHGRKFDMIRFDEQNFDHQLAGYVLEGSHAKVECRDCHKPDFITHPELKKREDSFLGLSQNCIDCHEDYHQANLSADCASCHDMDAFVPASFFDHDNSAYPLIGQHKILDCDACHQKSIKEGKEFQQFAGLDFVNCNSCHADVHNTNLGPNCKQCHTEVSFQSDWNWKGFNHNQTTFELKEKHSQIDCASCHEMNTTPRLIFQDRKGIVQNECIACHQDVHDNKFGIQCVDCHNESSFLNVNLSQFDHDVTNFSLEGKHQIVDCRECHQESLRDPVPHNTCASCHTDYHEGEFVSEGVAPDCKTCHTVDGFDYSLYTIEQHNESQFVLEGSHLATPCFACHLQDDHWRFRNIGQRCVDCHVDVHEGYIALEYYPNQSCEACHTPDRWQENHFDHELTGFKLEGKHLVVDCMECHLPDQDNEQYKYVGFVDLSVDCIKCHENIHGEQFRVDNKIDCARCHGFESWGMDDFNHNNTAFILEGKHKELSCDACHKQILRNEEILIQYKFDSFECIDCHQ